MREVVIENIMKNGERKNTLKDQDINALLFYLIIFKYFVNQFSLIRNVQTSM